MLLEILFLITGLVLLYYGSEWLVVGTSDIAISFSIRPIVVGLTIVAFATSAPELLVSLIASGEGASGISVGNILGSNIINISLVLGLSALFKPLKVSKSTTRVELPIMIVASLIFWFLCLDGNIGRMDGVILLMILFGFLIFSIINAKKNYEGIRKPENSLRKNIFLSVVGISALIFGADAVVDSAIFIAKQFGLNEIFIGITIVALGTSLPELATSVTASIKNQSDISLGNIVGSNLFNICMVMGTVGVLSPISIDSRLHSFEFPSLICISVLLYFLPLKHLKLGKSAGFIFISFFIIFSVISFLNKN